MSEEKLVYCIANFGEIFNVANMLTNSTLPTICASVHAVLCLYHQKDVASKRTLRFLVLPR